AGPVVAAGHGLVRREHPTVVGGQQDTGGAGNPDDLAQVVEVHDHVAIPVAQEYHLMHPLWWPTAEREVPRTSESDRPLVRGTVGPRDRLVFQPHRAGIGFPDFLDAGPIDRAHEPAVGTD